MRIIVGIIFDLEIHSHTDGHCHTVVGAGVVVERAVGYGDLLRVLDMDGVLVFVVDEFTAAYSDVLAQKSVLVELLSAELVVY